MSSSARDQGMTLRTAALVAGVGIVVMLVTSPFAEFYVGKKLIVPGAIEQTVVSLRAHAALFLAGIFAYLVNFIADVVVAWALYVLFRPVHPSLSLLTAWFRLVYTVISLVALLNLVAVFRLLTEPPAIIGAGFLYPQVELLLQSFRWGWGIAFIFFGIHLGMLGWLTFQSGFAPKVIGILLAIAGAGYIAYHVCPYVLPKTNVELLFITFFGELFFMFWLLIGGARLKDVDLEKQYSLHDMGNRSAT
jgi:hypothetical protein